MNVEQVFHMVGGGGETSYANNSRLQEKAIIKTKPLVEEAIKEICKTLPEKLVVADLGCSSGPNTFLVLSEIINAVDEHCCRLSKQKPEIQFFLNDLPNNDFNNVFQLLVHYEKQIREEKGDDFVSFYVVGLPGSFYGRLFPSKSVHFFHSSYCLMWLSQGLVEEDKLNAFNLPFYTPLMEEVKSTINMEGSFHLDQVQTFESNWDPFDESNDNFVENKSLSGKNVAKYIRAVLEPLFASHFGNNIMEDLFSRYAKNVARHMSSGKPKYMVFIFYLKLKNEEQAIYRSEYMQAIDENGMMTNVHAL